MNQQTLEKLFREKKPDVSGETIRTYAHSYRRIVHHVGPNVEKRALDEYLEELNPVIARNLLTAVVVLKGDGYRQIFDKYTAKAETIMGLQTKSPQQQKNWTSLRHIKRMISRMKENISVHKLFEEKTVLSRKTFRLLTAFISWMLHSEIPMRNDLPTVRLVYTTAETNAVRNFFVVSTRKLHLSQFKTASHFRKRGLLPLRFSLTKKLTNLLFLYLKKKPESDYLISNLDGSKLTKSSYHNLLTSSSYQYLGVRLGSTMFRHIVLSEFEKSRPSLRQRKEMMRKMQQLKIERQISYAFIDEP